MSAAISGLDSMSPGDCCMIAADRPAIGCAGAEEKGNTEMGSCEAAPQLPTMTLQLRLLPLCVSVQDRVHQVDLGACRICCRHRHHERRNGSEIKRHGLRCAARRQRV